MQFCRLTLLGLACTLLVGCVSVDVENLLFPGLTEQVLEQASRKTRNKIAVVDVNGFITIGREGRFSMVSLASLDELKAVLNQIESDPDVKAVILRIDSPGGDATASDMMYHEVVTFRQRTGLPVYASIMGMGTSGGYYLACAADQIHVHPTSITGSIGVIASFPNFEGLAKKIGVDQTVIKSGAMKDMANPMAPMDPEARRILQETIDTLYGQFLDAVAEGRPAYADAEAVRPVADGRIYTAPQALKLKLVDDIAYLSETIESVRKDVGLRDAHVITYLYGTRDDATIYSRASAPIDLKLVEMSLPNLDSHHRPGFMYLWEPGLPR